MNLPFLLLFHTISDRPPKQPRRLNQVPLKLPNNKTFGNILIFLIVVKSMGEWKTCYLEENVCVSSDAALLLFYTGSLSHVLHRGPCPLRVKQWACARSQKPLGGGCGTGRAGRGPCIRVCMCMNPHAQHAQHGRVCLIFCERARAAELKTPGLARTCRIMRLRPALPPLALCVQMTMI